MARKKANIHYIYKTTCNVTGRWYIGMHSTSNLEDGYMGSGTVLRHSIRKYGVENHTKEILEFLPTREELVLRETEIITKELISDGKCMNLKEGGNGGFTSEEHRNKAQNSGRETFINRLAHDVEFRNKINGNLYQCMKKYHKSGKHNYNTFEGKIHTDETKIKMSEKAKLRIGKANSQFGTCWITRDGTNKKIKKEDLETYLNEGWVKGRK
jgi:hypothetical protein